MTILKGLRSGRLLMNPIPIFETTSQHSAISQSIDNTQRRDAEKIKTGFFPVALCGSASLR
jgi:hypothetical protein